jgi:hypothetical protein
MWLLERRAQSPVSHAFEAHAAAPKTPCTSPRRENAAMHVRRLARRRCSRRGWHPPCVRRAHPRHRRPLAPRRSALEDHAIRSNGSSSARRSWNSTPQDETDDHATLPTRERDRPISIVTTSPSISPTALSSLTPAGEILRMTTLCAPPCACTTACKFMSCRSNARRLRRRVMWCAIFGCRRVRAG